MLNFGFCPRMMCWPKTYEHFSTLRFEMRICFDNKRLAPKKIALNLSSVEWECNRFCCVDRWLLCFKVNWCRHSNFAFHFIYYMIFFYTHLNANPLIAHTLAQSIYTLFLVSLAKYHFFCCRLESIFTKLMGRNRRKLVSTHIKSKNWSESEPNTTHTLHGDTWNDSSFLVALIHLFGYGQFDLTFWMEFFCFVGPTDGFC